MSCNRKWSETGQENSFFMRLSMTETPPQTHLKNMGQMETIVCGVLNLHITKTSTTHQTHITC